MAAANDASNSDACRKGVHVSVGKEGVDENNAKRLVFLFHETMGR
jgi:hypothetical protein